MTSPYTVVINLPSSDDTPAKDAQQVADHVQRHVQDFLDRDPVRGFPGCNVGVWQDATPTDTDPLPSILTAYDRLLSLHMDTLLKHGPQVAQGLALAISTMNEMLPDSEKNRAVQGWAENTAAEAERSSQ